MSVILPDDIRSLEQKTPNQQLQIIYEYIKYIREQLDFWGSNRESSISSIIAQIDLLTQLQIFDDEGNQIWPPTS